MSSCLISRFLVVPQWPQCRAWPPSANLQHLKLWTFSFIPVHQDQLEKHLPSGELTCKGSHPKWGLGLRQFCTSASTLPTPGLPAKSKRWIRQKYLVHYAHANNSGLAPGFLIDFALIIATHKHIARQRLVTPSGSRHQRPYFVGFFTFLAFGKVVSRFANHSTTVKRATKAAPGSSPGISLYCETCVWRGYGRMAEDLPNTRTLHQSWPGLQETHQHFLQEWVSPQISEPKAAIWHSKKGKFYRDL